VKTARAADQFLAGDRIAVTGVSRSSSDHGANIVFNRLRERGYTVFAVNPNAQTVEGERSYASVSEVPPPLHGVVIGTRPDRALGTVQECIDLGIERVWMHRAPVGRGSVSEAAATWGRAHGLLVIDGGCPCMFPPTDDRGHRVMRRVARLTGAVPGEV
jgi:predicted CoA-binding protein